MALQGANGRGLEAPEDGTRLVILIDALDELPSWLGVFITTRPEVDICGKRRFKRWWDASAAKGSTGHGEAVGAVPHVRPQDEGGGLAEA